MRDETVMKKSSFADLLAVDELVVEEKEVSLLRVAFGDFVQLTAVDHLCAGFYYIWTLHAEQKVRRQELKISHTILSFAYLPAIDSLLPFPYPPDVLQSSFSLVDVCSHLSHGPHSSLHSCSVRVVLTRVLQQL
jgi:hypothetical protein